MHFKTLSVLSKRACSALSGLLLLLFLSVSAYGQVPKPEGTFGFKPGADYKLANYEQELKYYKKLADASDRVKEIRIGTTTLGRPMMLLFISSKENMKHLDRWKEISKKMALAKISDKEAQSLSQEGKAIVWLDAGLHSTELAPGQMMPELAYRMATEESREMKKIRDNVVTLLMPMLNPDGLDIVSSWYNQTLGTPYESSGPPWLYHYYVGHDDNRDWFMNNMAETKAVSKILYQEWYPQIVYNHHQSAPAWTWISIPPYSNPVNQNINPAVTAGVNAIGSAMSERFALKKMPGAIAKTGFTMFWDGGARTVPYYHNQIGILTETAHTTPSPQYYDPKKLPKTVGEGTLTDGTDIYYPYPWKGGESHFRDAIDYTLTASMAVLNLAADRHEKYLWSIYKMGREAIEKGEAGNPYAYVIPNNNQWDEGEALNLVNILYRGGIQVEKASDSFQAGGKQYAVGSYIIYAGQAFRPYVMDLLEKQDYPTLLQYPGGPPDPPYDLAGWTLPMQMGVTVDRVNDSFKTGSKPMDDLVASKPGTVSGDAGFGYTLTTNENGSYKAVNALLKKGLKVYRTDKKVGDAEPGSFIIDKNGGGEKAIKKWADQEGLNFAGLSQKPGGSLHQIKSPKVGLYKSWSANIDEGWTRWLMDTYGFQSDSLHDDYMQNGDLSKYDVIIIPSQYPSRILHGNSPGSMPEKYVGGMGLKGSLALNNYVEQGGTVIAFDAASDFMIDQFGLPVRDVISGLPNTRFYIPGSLIRIKMEAGHPLNYGMQDETAAAFSRSRAFSIEEPGGYRSRRQEIKKAPAPDVEVVSKYADKDLLMSGWAMGADRYLAGKDAVLSVKHGDGHIILFGFRPQFRGQPRGTYKLIFNAIYGSTMDTFPSKKPAAEE